MACESHWEVRFVSDLMASLLYYCRAMLLLRGDVRRLILLDERYRAIDNRACREAEMIALGDEIQFPFHLAWVCAYGVFTSHGLFGARGSGSVWRR